MHSWLRVETLGSPKIALEDLCFWWSLAINAGV